MKEKDLLIELDKDKKLHVNLESVEDLINSITYATNQLNEAKKGIGKSKFDEESISQKIIEKLPNKDLYQTVIFELEKFKNIDKVSKRTNIKNVLLTMIVTSIVVVASLMYSKIDDKLTQYYLVNKIKNKNYVLPKNKVKLLKNNKYQIIFQKK